MEQDNCLEFPDCNTKQHSLSFLLVKMVRFLLMEELKQDVITVMGVSIMLCVRVGGLVCVFVCC